MVFAKPASFGDNRERSQVIMTSSASFFASPSFDLEVSSDDETECRDPVAEETENKQTKADPGPDNSSSLAKSLSFRRGISLVCDTGNPSAPGDNGKDESSVDDNYALDYSELNSDSIDGVYPISSLSYSASPRAYCEPSICPEQAISKEKPCAERQSSNPSSPFHAWKFRQLQSSPIKRISKLLENQRARFGMDMFQAIIDEADQREIESLQSDQGFSFEEAALYKFNKLRGLTLPEPGRLSKTTSDARPRAIQCVRIPSPKTNSWTYDPVQSMSGHNPPSPGNTSQRSHFSFLSGLEDDTQLKDTLGIIERAITFYHEKYEEFFSSLPTAHYTALREMLSQQELIMGKHMFGSLDGFDFCRVQTLCIKGFTLDKAVWRVFVLRNPNWRNHPAAWFLRDSSDAVDLGPIGITAVPSSVTKSRSGSTVSIMASEEYDTAMTELTNGMNSSCSPKVAGSWTGTPTHVYRNTSGGHSPASLRPGSYSSSPLHRESLRSHVSSAPSSLTPSPLASPSNFAILEYQAPLSPNGTSSVKKHAASALHGLLSAPLSSPTSANPPSPTYVSAPPLSPHSPQVRRHFFHDPIYDRAVHLHSYRPADST